MVSRVGTIMGMKLRQQVEAAVPVIPTDTGHWAWIEARAEQVIAIVAATGEPVRELWVELHPDMVAALVSELIEQGADVVANPLPTVEACTTASIAGGDVVLYVVANDELDQTSFLLSVGDASQEVEIAATGILGFVYPSPVSESVVATRWILQHDDGTPGEIADTTSSRL